MKFDGRAFPNLEELSSEAAEFGSMRICDENSSTYAVSALPPISRFLLGKCRLPEGYSK
jgi:hypothetical protein